MKRQKPLAAFESERRAEENLRAKLDFLTDLVRLRQHARIGVAEHDGQAKVLFPRSVRQFNLWDTAREPTFNPTGIPVRRNSNETLRRYPELLTALTKVLALLNTPAALDSMTRSGKRSRSLKQQLTQSEELRSILESERIEIQRALSRLQAENASLIRKVDTLTKALAESIAKGRDMNGRLSVIRRDR